MKLFHSSFLLGVASVLLLPMYLTAQPKSAIQFYDTTGTTETANIGWTGNATSGKFSVQTPIDGEVLKIENGNMTVDGTISTTAGFAGKGTALTDINPSSHIHPEIGTLTSGLAGKSDKVHTHSGSEINDSVPLSKISTVGAASQQVLTFTGTNAAWQNPPTSSGTAEVTSVSTDSGLVVNPTTGAVKISIGPKLVTNGMLKDSVITGVKIKTNAVETANIADNAITTAKIAKGTDGQVLTSTATGVQWAVPTGSGVTSVETDSGLVVNPATGAVKVSIGQKAVSSGMIKDSAVTGVKIKTKSIETAHLNPSASSAVQVLTSSGASVAWQPPSGILSVSGTSGINAATSGGAVTLSAMFTASGGDSGTATTVSRGDHMHSQYQQANAHLSDLADDGILTGSKVGSGINASNITTGSLSGSLISPDFGSQEIRLSTGSISFDENLSDNAKFRINAESHSTGPRLYFSRFDPTDNSWHAIAYANRNGTQEAFHCYGTITATTCCTSSDSLLKQNVELLENAMEKVNALRGVSYEWNQTVLPERNLPSGREIGLIAQEVETILPSVVKTDSDGYKSIEYGKITALLIEAVKEQNKYILSYEERIQRLEKMLAKINGE